MIAFFTEEVDFSLKDKMKIKRWLREVAIILGRPSSFKIKDVNYIFCSDDYLLAINRQYLGHDYYTDIITFDESSDADRKRNTVSADIYISIDTVKANAITYKEGFDRELKRVMAHGILHLIGYDDVAESKRKQMQLAENKALDLYETIQ
ncbi:MAG: rRNA maturation RNase YbeY [Bacteroidales bacterium]|nr:rRNA maturation RNase YbeY [Bacteroidales bacterium]